MKWLITGGEGQLGRALTSLLRSQNAEVYSLNAKQLDVTDLAQVRECFGGIRPEVIVNLAAWTNVDTAESHKIKSHLVNAVGVMYLAEQAKKLKSIFVQVSTDYVFSGINDSPWKEDDLPVPVSQYGLSKLNGERLVKTVYPEKSYLIRTAWLYSEFGSNFPKTIIRKALNSSGEIKVVNDQWGQPTNCWDLSHQIIEVVRNSIDFGIYHATNSGFTNRFEFAQEVLSLSGEDKCRVMPVSTDFSSDLAKRPLYSVLAHDSWSLTPVKPLRHWKSALESNINSILTSVSTEKNFSTGI